jgi:hypothetical protein
MPVPMIPIGSRVTPNFSVTDAEMKVFKRKWGEEAALKFILECYDSATPVKNPTGRKNKPVASSECGKLLREFFNNGTRDGYEHYRAMQAIKKCIALEPSVGHVGFIKYLRNKLANIKYEFSKVSFEYLTFVIRYYALWAMIKLDPNLLNELATWLRMGIDEVKMMFKVETTTNAHLTLKDIEGALYHNVVLPISCQILFHFFDQMNFESIRKKVIVSRNDSQHNTLVYIPIMHHFYTDEIIVVHVGDVSGNIIMVDDVMEMSPYEDLFIKDGVPATQQHFEILINPTAIKQLRLPVLYDGMNSCESDHGCAKVVTVDTTHRVYYFVSQMIHYIIDICKHVYLAQPRKMKKPVAISKRGVDRRILVTSLAPLIDDANTTLDQNPTYLESILVTARILSCYRCPKPVGEFYDYIVQLHAHIDGKKWKPKVETFNSDGTTTKTKVHFRATTAAVISDYDRMLRYIHNVLAIFMHTSEGHALSSNYGIMSPDDVDKKFLPLWNSPQIKFVVKPDIKDHYCSVYATNIILHGLSFSSGNVSRYLKAIMPSENSPVAPLGDWAKKPEIPSTPKSKKENTLMIPMSEVRSYVINLLHELLRPDAFKDVTPALSEKESRNQVTDLVADELSKALSVHSSENNGWEKMPYSNRSLSPPKLERAVGHLTTDNLFDVLCNNTDDEEDPNDEGDHDPNDHPVDPEELEKKHDADGQIIEPAATKFISPSHLSDAERNLALRKAVTSSWDDDDTNANISQEAIDLAKKVKEGDA